MRAAVGAVLAILNPRFLLPVNIANTSNLVGLFGLSAIGQAFVIITGGIELSVGSVIALVGVLFMDLIANEGVPWPLALVIVLGVLIGLAHGLLITKLKLQPFIVTLCGLLVYRGIARFYTQDATVGFGFGQNFSALNWLTGGETLGVPHSFIAMMIVAVIMWVVLHRTVFGRHLYAVGKNEEAARFSGIRTDRVVIFAYIICQVLTVAAAVYFAMYTGSIVGVVLGVVLLQELQNLVNLLGIPSLLNFAVMGGVILIGVTFDQQLGRLRLRRCETKTVRVVAPSWRSRPPTDQRRSRRGETGGAGRALLSAAGDAARLGPGSIMFSTAKVSA
jgi:ribose transport system permease protein